MFKYYVLICLIGILHLAACTNTQGTGSAVESDGIPGMSAFVPQQGAPLSEQDWKFLEIASKDPLFSPESYLIFEKNDLSGQKQNAKRARLNDKIKTYLSNIEKNCIITQPIKNTSGNLNPNQGQNTSLAITKSFINGPICPLSFQSEEKTNTQILNFSKEKSTLLLGISSSKSTTLNISEINMARNFGIRLWKSDVNFSGKGLYVDNHSKMYFKGNGLVTIESLRQFISNIEIRGSFEGLMAGAFKENEPGTPTSGEAYAHLQITGFGNPLLISLNFKIGDGGKMTVVLYANGQKTDVYQSQILMRLFDVEHDSNYQVEADGTVALDPK